VLDSGLQIAVQEFATWLNQTQPLVELRRAQEQLETDAEAQRLLVERDKKERELLERQRSGQVISMAEVKTLRQLQSQIQNHPTVRAYLEMQRQLQSYLTDLNVEISRVLEVDFGALSQGVEK